MKKVLVAATAVLFSFAVSAQTAPTSTSKASSPKTAEKKEMTNKKEVTEKKEVSAPSTQKSHKTSHAIHHETKNAKQEVKPSANSKK